MRDSVTSTTVLVGKFRADGGMRQYSRSPVLFSLVARTMLLCILSLSFCFLLFVPVSGQPVIAGQPMATTQVVTVTQQAQLPPGGQPPPDYLAASILSCIFCCWIIGIFAIVYSVATRNANDMGDYVTAAQKSQTTRSLVIATVVVGLIIIVADIIYYVA